MPWSPCALFKADAIAECSGMVASGIRDDLFWVHNDSGDAARIFAVNSQAELLLEVHMDTARNHDWEDITKDRSGHLYLGDFGNNFNNRRDLVIYVIDEPSVAPEVQEKGRPKVIRVPLTQKIRFRYPEQQGFPDPEHLNFDCESLFWSNDHLYLLTKHRSDTRTVLYRLTLDTERIQDAQKVGEFEMGSMVTAADVSADGRYLVVLSYQYLHLFERPEQGDNYLSRPVNRVLIEGRQCEAVCFRGNQVVFANEQREVYCLLLEDLKTAETFLPTQPRVQLQKVNAQLDGALAEYAGIEMLPLHADWSGPVAQGPAPELRLAWSDAGLLLAARFEQIPVTQGGEQPLLQVMLGPVGHELPRLGSLDRVWSVFWEDGVVVRQQVPGRAPWGARGPIAANVLVQHRLHPGHLDVEMLFPCSDLLPANRVAFNVLSQPAQPGSVLVWAWAGSFSTQPLGNPLLWGIAELRISP